MAKSHEAAADYVRRLVADGIDCLMLLEEKAMGKYPEHAVAFIARVAAITNPHCNPLDAQTAVDSTRSLHETGAERRIALRVY